MPEKTLPYLLECEPLQALLAEPAGLERHGILLLHVGGTEDYRQAHIPGAQFIDAAQLNLGLPPAPGLLPARDALQSLLRRVGLDANRWVIAYDCVQGQKAARLLWVLEAVGHRQVSLLNGGLIAWSQGGALEQAVSPTRPSTIRLGCNPNVIADKHYVLDSIDHPERRILDARSAAEHAGLKSASERRGRIPSSVHLDWLDTIDTANGYRLKSRPQLQALLEQRGVRPELEIIVHCQTHQRSAHSFAMLRSLGFPRVRGYAGSWSEWSSDPALPVAGG